VVEAEADLVEAVAAAEVVVEAEAAVEAVARPGAAGVALPSADSMPHSATGGAISRLPIPGRSASP
jgi:hypothetical protein